MTSTPLLDPWKAAKSQPVRRYLNNIKLHGNLERGAHKHFICALCSAPSLALPWVSDCGTEFLIAQAFCWDCIARIVSIYPPIPTHPPLPTPQCRPILFICHVSSLDWGRGGMHGCPGAQGVEMWRADKRASVDRRLLCLDGGLGGSHGLRVNWSRRRHTVNLSWWYCVGGMPGSIVSVCIQSYVTKLRRNGHFTHQMW